MENKELHDLTYEELIPILTMDGTWSEIKDAVRDMEITEEECQKVLSFVSSKDAEKSKELFQEVLGNIKAQPVFDTNEDLQKWAEYREEVARKLEELKRIESQCMEQVKKMEMSVAQLQDKIEQQKKDGNRDLKEYFLKLNEEKSELRRATQTLNIKTKQIMALQLVELHAKTPDRQQENYHKAQAREPVFASLKRAWALHLEHAQNLNKVMEQTKDLSKIDRAEDRINKSHLKNAKAHVKEFNKLKADISKAEAKMIAVAQKISNQEFRRNQHLNRLEHWCKGAPLDKASKPLEIKDISMATNVIKNTTQHLTSWQQVSLEESQKSLERLKERAVEMEKAAVSSLEGIAQILRDRKATIEKTVVQVAEQERGGELGHVSDKKMGQIERNFAKAMERTYIDKELLKGSMFSKDLDMAGFMKDHNLGDIIEPSEIEIGNR